jgi:hypothetical protein
MIKNIALGRLKLQGKLRGRPAPSKEKYSITWEMHPSLQEGFNALRTDMKHLVKKGCLSVAPDTKTSLNYLKYESSHNELNMDIQIDLKDDCREIKCSRKEKYELGIILAQDYIYFSLFHSLIGAQHERATKHITMGFSGSELDMLFEHRSDELDIKYKPQKFVCSSPLQGIRFDWDRNNKDLALCCFSFVLDTKIASILNDLPIKFPFRFIPISRQAR